MSDLIEALTILCQYTDCHNPTNCLHDMMLIMDIEKDGPSAKHQARLDELGFFWSEEFGCWALFRFESA